MPITIAIVSRLIQIVRCKQTAITFETRDIICKLKLKLATKKEGKKVNAILSDYDGTLCTTTSVRDENSHGVGTIPRGLEQILFRISEHIPIIYRIESK